ncbi:hypothetical protein Glo7428_2980 [Gloeocapsa sp. PCC 7428]|nr:hypothetical protein Glo7428_2980 [Gloeocapsa sp. PCC 7428]
MLVLLKSLWSKIKATKNLIIVGIIFILFFLFKVDPFISISLTIHEEILKITKFVNFQQSQDIFSMPSNRK